MFLAKFKKISKPRLVGGFSFVEVLFVILVISVIALISISAFKGMNERQVLDKGRLSVLSILNEARSLSLSSKDSSDHGVYLEEDKIISFIGSSYSPDDPRNSTYNLNSLIRVSSVVPQSIVFKRTTGVLTGESQIINISLKSNQNASSSVIIYSTGLIQKNLQ